MFTRLKTKLVGAKNSISSFIAGFEKEGVYVFGDYATAENIQTIILVTQDEKCEGKTVWPLTIENMKKLDIKGNALIFHGLLSIFDRFNHRVVREILNNSLI